MSTPQTLIADDQPDILEALRLLLKGEGYRIEIANSPAAVLEKLKARDYDLLLLDLNYARDTTSGQEGLDLLARIKAMDSGLPIVAMTAWGTVPLAVEAMRRGVRDFVLKPWENRRLLDTIRSEIERGRKERLENWLQAQELEQAREVERALLPAKIPQVQGFEIAAAWQPAQDVGGDALDVLKFSESRVGLSIGDVMGKGLPAALLMSNLQAAVRACASDILPVNQLCQRVNRVLCGNMSSGRFVTFVYCFLDARTHTLAYANAGHDPPILLRSSGEAVLLRDGGPVFGIFPHASYEEGRMELASGDRLVLFTDGVTEARNRDGQEFGQERLIELLSQHCRLGAESLKNRVLSAVSEFGDPETRDDATLIVVAVM